MEHSDSMRTVQKSQRFIYEMRWGRKQSKQNENMSLENEMHSILCVEHIKNTL